jgi:hypothetical protein
LLPLYVVTAWLNGAGNFERWDIPKLYVNLKNLLFEYLFLAFSFLCSENMTKYTKVVKEREGSLAMQHMQREVMNQFSTASIL